MIEFIIHSLPVIAFVLWLLYPFSPKLDHDADEDENFEDWLEVINTSDDYREDPDLRGVLSSCFYCGTILLHDGDQEDDFVIDEPEIHCEECTATAQRNLCG